MIGFERRADRTGLPDVRCPCRRTRHPRNLGLHQAAAEPACSHQQFRQTGRRHLRHLCRPGHPVGRLRRYLQARQGESEDAPHYQERRLGTDQGALPVRPVRAQNWRAALRRLPVVTAPQALALANEPRADVERYDALRQDREARHAS
jgi:hypothetical protein